MNEKKKLSLLLVIVGTIILTVLICSFIDSKKSNKVYNEVKNLYNSKEINIIYLGRDDCGYCKMFNPVIENISTKYNIEYKNVNINDLSNSDLEKMINLLKINADSFGTPYLIISKDGKVVATQSGYTTEAYLFKFFQDNDIISKDISNPYLAGLDDEVIKSFNDIYTSETKQLIYLGRPTCGYCEQFSPILEKISNEYEFEYHYINIDELTELQLTTILINLNKNISGFGTPYLAVVQNGKLVGELPGYTEEEYLIKFLEEYGIIN